MLRIGITGLVLMIWVAGVADAAQLNTLRDELQVNGMVKRLDQDHATVAMDGNGHFMVTWQTPGGYDGDGYAVMARSFDKAGLPMGNDFSVNSTTAGHQRVPDVVSTGPDRFAIVWSSGTDAAGYNVMAKVVSSDGSTLISEMKVNTTASKFRTWPGIAAYRNGDFLVVWDQVVGNELNFYARFYDATGHPRAAMRLNDVPSHIPPNNTGYGLPEVSVNESGAAVAVWEQLTKSHSMIVRRKFFPYLGSLEQAVVVDPPAAGIDQRRPSVDMNGQGDILISWAELPVIEGGDENIFIKKYNGVTDKWSKRMMPYANAAGNQHRCMARLTSDGGVFVAWTNEDPVYNDDVYMRFYSNRGVPLTGELLVSNTRENVQKRPALALIDDMGQVDLVVTWEGTQNGLDIFEKIYRVLY